MAEPIAQTVPREMWLYHDRGMMNWMGWLLSDHSAYLEKEAHAQGSVKSLAEMSPQALDACLTKAWEQQLPVAIQLEAPVASSATPELQGLVVANDGGCVCLQTEAGQTQLLAIDDIRHARLVTPTHWWAA